VDIFSANRLTLSVLSFSICLCSYGGARYRVSARLYRRIDVSRFVHKCYIECRTINVICVNGLCLKDYLR